MSAFLGNSMGFPTKSTGKETRLWRASVTFGSSAIASSDTPDPGITFTRTGTGTFTATFPACKKGRLFFSLESAALTVVGVVVTALDVTAGTAGFTTVNGSGAATDPATGNKLAVLFVGDIGMV